jgi:hypothetical protein
LLLLLYETHFIQYMSWCLFRFLGPLFDSSVIWYMMLFCIERITVVIDILHNVFRAVLRSIRRIDIMIVSSTLIEKLLFWRRQNLFLQIVLKDIAMFTRGKWSYLNIECPLFMVLFLELCVAIISNNSCWRILLIWFTVYLLQMTERGGRCQE